MKCLVVLHISNYNALVLEVALGEQELGFFKLSFIFFLMIKTKKCLSLGLIHVIHIQPRGASISPSVCGTLLTSNHFAWM